METKDKIEIKKNEFLRQFEARIDDELVILEYSEQSRKIFLTKLIISDELLSRERDQEFLTTIFENFEEEGNRIVPTCPLVAQFYKSNRAQYRPLLATGINL